MRGPCRAGPRDARGRPVTRRGAGGARCSGCDWSRQGKFEPAGAAAALADALSTAKDTAVAGWPAAGTRPASTRRRAERRCAACSTRSSTCSRSGAPPHRPRRDAPALRRGARHVASTRPGAPTAASGDAPAGADLSLRVEADEEELVAGAVRLVPQVHDEQDPLHLVRRRRCCGPARRTATASATAPAPTPPSRCARRPTRGRCSTGCSSCGCPTRSRSTATSWSACSTTASPPSARGVDVLVAAQPGPRPDRHTVLDRRPGGPATGAAPEPARRRLAVHVQLAARPPRRAR